MANGQLAGTVIPLAALGIAGPNMVQRPQRYRGSAWRGGRSLVAIGVPPQNVGIGATATFTFTISEPGYLGRLFAAASVQLGDVLITSIKHNNDELITSEVTGEMFAQDAIQSPGFGHYVEVADAVSITLRNDNAAAQDVRLAWSVA